MKESTVAMRGAMDVPTGEDPRLVIAAYLPRADPDGSATAFDSRRGTPADSIPLGYDLAHDLHADFVQLWPRRRVGNRISGKARNASALARAPLNDQQEES